MITTCSWLDGFAFAAGSDILRHSHDSRYKDIAANATTNPA